MMKFASYIADLEIGGMAVVGDQVVELRKDERSVTVNMRNSTLERVGTNRYEYLAEIDEGQFDEVVKSFLVENSKEDHRCMCHASIGGSTEVQFERLYNFVRNKPDMLRFAFFMNEDVMYYVFYEFKEPEKIEGIQTFAERTACVKMVDGLMKTKGDADE
jgi:hypothetical protein